MKRLLISVFLGSLIAPLACGSEKTNQDVHRDGADDTGSDTATASNDIDTVPGSDARSGMDSTGDSDSTDTETGTLDTLNGADTPGGTDTGEAAVCITGDYSCQGSLLRLCEGGAWIDWTECAVDGRVCAVKEGQYQCVFTTLPDTGSSQIADSATETAGVADSDSMPDSDSDLQGDTAPDTVSDSASDSTPGTDAQCVDIPWTVDATPINLLVLLDRSKSMKKYTVEGSDVTYAEMVKNAINAIVDQHTSAGNINFALNVFPSPEQCDAEYHADDVVLDSQILCEAASQFTSPEAAYQAPLVPFSDNITAATTIQIADVLENVGNCGGTPIAKSLEWARVYLDSLSLENDTYVLLATDGAPGCNYELDLSTCESASLGYEPRAPEMCLDAEESARAVYNLAVAGYKTFVLGVGKDVEAFHDVTNSIAYWGTNIPDSEPTDFMDIPDPPAGENWYYPAGDPQTVSAALADLTYETISCEFEVDWAGVPSFDTASQQIVLKSCAQTRVFGAIQGSGEEVEITYMESCDDEVPESDNTKLRIGWTWKEHEGTPWESIVSLGDDTSSCGTIKLCTNACSKLKTSAGIPTWSGISASFGCRPALVIE